MAALLLSKVSSPDARQRLASINIKMERYRARLRQKNTENINRIIEHDNRKYRTYVWVYKHSPGRAIRPDLDLKAF